MGKVTMWEEGAQTYGASFKIKENGIQADDIRWVIAAYLQDLYRHGVLIGKPTEIKVKEEEITHKDNTISKWVNTAICFEQTDKMKDLLEDVDGQKKRIEELAAQSTFQNTVEVLKDQIVVMEE